MSSEIGFDISGNAQSETASLPFVVGFFFSFRLFILLLSVRLLDIDPRVGVELNLGLNYLLLVLVAFNAMGDTRPNLDPILKLASVRWVVFFLGFTCCSLIWSSAAELSSAIAYWVGMFADAAIVALLYRAIPVKTAAHSLIKGFVWGACFVAVIAWLLPAQSDLRLGDEELIGANQIGFLCAFAFFLAQYLFRAKDGKWKLAMCILGVTLLRSLSKTTIVAFLFSQGFLLIQDKSITRKTKVAIVSVVAVVTLVFWSLLQSYYVIYTSAGNSPETLTGRLGIWAYFIDAALERPWFGYGFHSVWKVIPPFGSFEARHAHNEIIQQFYAYGMTGICMMAGLYGSFYRQARRLSLNKEKMFFVALLIFILIRGFADTEVFDLSLPVWSILLFSVLMREIERSSARLQVMPIQESVVTGMRAFPALS
jgi:exopolysaccharide production protein ExoQ